MKCAIAGLGLLGGSLALALRQKFPDIVLAAWGRNAERLHKAKRSGLVDFISTDERAAVAGAEVVLLATSVESIPVVFERLLPHLSAQTLVMDVGSVKNAILATVQKIYKKHNVAPRSGPFFVAAHPMAGSEKTGFENAHANLYKGATVVLCPWQTPQKVLARAEKFWRQLGARPLFLSAREHDRIVARTSHLPHVLASALVENIAQLTRRHPGTPLLLAGSFRDATRVSDSSSELWAEIATLNSTELMAAIDAYQKQLARLIQRAGQSSNKTAFWRKYFASARKSHAELLGVSR